MSNIQFSLKELALKTGAKVVGDGSAMVSGIATLQSATDTQISFLANPAYAKYLSETKAAAVIVSPEFAGKCKANVLVHENPYLVYAKISHLWDGPAVEAGKNSSIDSSAVIHELAKIGENVSVDAGAVIQSGAIIESGVIIGANCVVGADSLIGENTRLHAGVTIYHGVSIGQMAIIHSGVVIGSDGFGFAPDEGKWQKIAQLGGVIIGGNVEIGANTTIDRGALDNTYIDDGVKLDNQIQIAHNVHIGKDTAIAACCAIAGSTSIGKNCVLGGASGVAGHLTIADNVHITAMTMVIKNLPEPGVYSSGTGVQPNAKWRKSIARLRQLDKMAIRLKALEKIVDKGTKEHE